MWLIKKIVLLYKGLSHKHLGHQSIAYKVKSCPMIYFFAAVVFFSYRIKSISHTFGLCHTPTFFYVKIFIYSTYFTTVNKHAFKIIKNGRAWLISFFCFSETHFKSFNLSVMAAIIFFQSYLLRAEPD